MGVWIPDWNGPGEYQEHRKEENLSAPSLGQTGSFTGTELAAWLLVLTKPIRSMYATDSASMLRKALYLIQQARFVEEKEMRGQQVNIRISYKKPRALQKYGDL